ANPKASDVYTAKARGKLFAPTITGLIAPTGNVDPFCLVVELQRKSGALPADLRASAPVSSSAPYAALELPQVAFPEPENLVLVLTGKLDESELAFLLIADTDEAGPIPRDVSFCNAVRQLLQAPDPAKPFVTTACVGLEQLTEVTAKAVLDS